MGYCKGICINGKRCKIKLNWKEYCHIHGQDCGICYEPVKNKFKTECGHSFCKDCIYHWFIQNFNCPYCRKDLYNVELTTDITYFGIEKKLLAVVTDIFLDISSLGDQELEIIEYTGIKPNCYMTDTEWIIKKEVLSENHPEIYLKISMLAQKTKKNIVKTTPENFEEFQNSVYWLFD